MQKIKTNFEQIPVAIVKKIAEVEESKKKDIATDPPIVETPVSRTKTYSATAALHCRNGL